MKDFVSFPQVDVTVGNCHLEGIAIVPIERFKELVETEKKYNEKYFTYAEPYPHAK